jgi:hypothetical protein
MTTANDDTIKPGIDTVELNGGGADELGGPMEDEGEVLPCGAVEDIIDPLRDIASWVMLD